MSFLSSEFLLLSMLKSVGLINISVKKKGDAFLKEVYYEPKIIIATLK